MSTGACELPQTLEFEAFGTCEQPDRHLELLLCSMIHSACQQSDTLHSTAFAATRKTKQAPPPRGLDHGS